jgi:hypothetical protein
VAGTSAVPSAFWARCFHLGEESDGRICSSAGPGMCEALDGWSICEPWARTDGGPRTASQQFPYSKKATWTITGFRSGGDGTYAAGGASHPSEALRYVAESFPWTSEDLLVAGAGTAWEPPTKQAILEWTEAFVDSVHSEPETTPFLLARCALLWGATVRMGHFKAARRLADAVSQQPLPSDHRGWEIRLVEFATAWRTVRVLSAYSLNHPDLLLRDAARIRLLVEQVSSSTAVHYYHHVQHVVMATVMGELARGPQALAWKGPSLYRQRAIDPIRKFSRLVGVPDRPLSPGELLQCATTLESVCFGLPRAPAHH